MSALIRLEAIAEARSREQLEGVRLVDPERQCACGKAIRSDNRTGSCRACQRSHRGAQLCIACGEALDPRGKLPVHRRCVATALGSVAAVR